ncbi:unnamed protein product, partial [Mesorhabditis belari]|uniref:Dynein light chain n=1 Tax=Mesorhabditis belari TaxID=2138241 RepID=A0AAF3FIB2_9BILA
MSGRKLSIMAFGYMQKRRRSSARRKESRRWKEPPSKALRASQIEMKSSSLEDEMTSDAIQTLSDALDKGGIENDIATYMKSTFEKKYGNNWNCIVGRNFGSHLSCVEHVHLSVSKISVLLFRCE